QQDFAKRPGRRHHQRRPTRRQVARVRLGTPRDRWPRDGPSGGRSGCAALPLRPSVCAHRPHREGKGRELCRGHVCLAQQQRERRRVRSRAGSAVYTMSTVAAATTDWRSRCAKQTRLAYGQALLELGAKEPRTVVVSADTQDLLGIRTYIERYPERFVEL